MSRFANRILSKAKRYVASNPSLNKDEMYRMLRERGESNMMINHVMKIIKRTSDD